MAEKGKDKDEVKETKEVKEESIDPKHLRGLTYGDAEEREIEEDGGKKKRSFPRTQPMRPEHVLAWKDSGAELVIVSKDGKKHRVKK